MSNILKDNTAHVSASNAGPFTGLINKFSDWLSARHLEKEARLNQRARGRLLARYPGYDYEDITVEMRDQFRKELRLSAREKMQSVYDRREDTTPLQDPLARHTIAGGRVVSVTGQVLCENIRDIGGNERVALEMNLKNYAFR